MEEEREEIEIFIDEDGDMWEVETTLYPIYEEDIED